MSTQYLSIKNTQDQEFKLNHNDNAGAISLDSDKIVSKLLVTSVVPSTNSTMEFQLTSNTQLTIKVKGSDGVVRSANITLA
jgi:hypothetical protein